jgi:hypothetical protein
MPAALRHAEREAGELKKSEKKIAMPFMRLLKSSNVSQMSVSNLFFVAYSAYLCKAKHIIQKES